MQPPICSADERQQARFRLRNFGRDHFLALKGKRVTEFAVPVGQSLTAAWLVLMQTHDGDAMVFSSDPINVGGWNELGCLIIEAATEGAVREMINFPLVAWPVSDFVIAEVSALVYEDESWRIECGVALHSTNGRDVLVVPGIPPGSVTIRLETGIEAFAPELQVEEYKLWPLANAGA
jgi:hypothetical protein